MFSVSATPLDLYLLERLWRSFPGQEVGMDQVGQQFDSIDYSRAGPSKI
jgi:hypothetical protein